MSVRRPGRRYIGFRFTPATASRREVTRILDATWAAEAPSQPESKPRLLVCEAGMGILVVPTGAGKRMREALGRPVDVVAGFAMEPVVTSGTIATVKERMGLPRRPPR